MIKCVVFLPPLLCWYCANTMFGFACMCATLEAISEHGVTRNKRKTQHLYACSVMFAYALGFCREDSTTTSSSRLHSSSPPLKTKPVEMLVLWSFYCFIWKIPEEKKSILHKLNSGNPICEKTSQIISLLQHNELTITFV